MACNNFTEADFIEAIESHPSLYKINDVTYRNKNIKQNAWEVIASKFSITGKKVIL